MILRKTITRFLLICLLIIPTITSAQEDNQLSLYVGEINITQDKLSAGQTISGTFEIHNTAYEVYSSVKHRIELAEIFEDTFNYRDEDGNITESVKFDQLTDSFDVSNQSDSYSVLQGTISVPFSYKIPQNIPDGRIALVVQLFNGNIDLNYDFIEIEIDGPKYNLIPSDGRIFIGQEAFLPLEGPIVEKGEEVKLDVHLNNTSKTVLTLNPNLKVFKGNNRNGEVVYQETFDQITVPATATNLKISYALPVTLDPSVYTVVVDFSDDAGISRTIPVEARYIIDGIKPKIGEVFYNSTDLILSDKFGVSVSYLDTPPSFRKNPDGTYKDSRVQATVEYNKKFNADEVLDSPYDFYNFKEEQPVFFLEEMTAVVKVFDSKTDELIETQRIQFNQSLNSTAWFDSFKDVEELRIEVDLYQNGELIDTYKDTVNVFSSKHDTVFYELWREYKYYILATLILIVVVVFAFFVKSTGRYKKEFIASIFAIALVFGSFIFFGDAQELQAAQVDEGMIGGANVSSPQPPSAKSYMPNSNVNFTLSFQFRYCTNQPNYNLKVRVTKPVLKDKNHSSFGAWQRPSVGQSLTVNANEVGNVTKHRKHAASITLPFKAPNNEGTYKFKYEISLTGNSDWYDVDSGEVRFKVKDTGQLPVEDFIPTIWCSSPEVVVGVNQPVTLSAQLNTYEPASYNWYRSSLTWLNNLDNGSKKMRDIDSYLSRHNIQHSDYIGRSSTIFSQVIGCREDWLSLSSSRPWQSICPTKKIDGSVLEHTDRVSYIEGLVTEREQLRINGHRMESEYFSANNLLQSMWQTSGTYTTTYDVPGTYYIRMNTRANVIWSGMSMTHPYICNYKITVSGDEILELEDIDLSDEQAEVILEDGMFYYVDEDGNKYLLDSNAALGKINFDLEGGLTNNTCKANWSAENVLKCSLYRNDIKVKDIEFTGNEDLTPGTYQIRCIQSKDGAEIRSETRVCRGNPDFREM